MTDSTAISRRAFLRRAAALGGLGALALTLPGLSGCRADPGERPVPTETSPPPRELVVGGVSLKCPYYWYLESAVQSAQRALPQRRVRLIETTGSRENLERLAAGELALAMVSADLVYQAFHGQGWWTAPTFESLRMLWYFLSEPLIFLVREDAGIESLSDLAGKPFIPGARFSDAERISKHVLTAIGVQPDWRAVDRADIVSAVASGEALGFSWPIPPVAMDGMVAQAAQTISLRPLTWSPAQIAQVRQRYPYLETKSVPAGTFHAALDSPTVGWRVTIGVAATSELPESDGYFLAKAVLENSRQLVASLPTLEGVDAAQVTAEAAVTPMHMGAWRYFQALPVNLPYEATPPEAACYLICRDR